MDLRNAFGQSLRRQRKARGLAQEVFTNVSSRTYMSQLERGLKNPSLDKIDELASIIGIHPLTLLTECYALKDSVGTEELFSRIARELESLRDT